jgi:hypothetical protein
MLMQDLREYVNRFHLTRMSCATDMTEEDRYALESVLSCSKDWADRSPNSSQTHNFDVIRFYTSEFGYSTIFALLNMAFRTDAVMEQGQQNDLRSAVFLIELLNIDLFNYLSWNPSKSGFQGTVYRGVSFTKEGIEDFRNLATMPVRDRYWSIPLAMMSASTNMKTSLKFALQFAQSDATTRHPFLWRIHIVNLDPDLLQIYNDRFPSSVVTTLCAVPVDEVSVFSKEHEVLLRGPFFQFIRLQQEYVHDVGMTMDVMDLVMLNTNRDHPTTTELGGKGDEARRLFAVIVGISRSRKCKDLAHEYGLAMDADEFGRIHDEQVDRLRCMELGKDAR